MGISENADSPLLCSREIKLMQYSKDDDYEKFRFGGYGEMVADIMEMYSTEYLRYVIEEYMTLIQKHRKLLVLLFFHAQGSSLENFKENFTERSTSLVKEYFRDMKEKHPQMNINVTDFSIHLHTAWMFTMFEELIMHRVGTEDLEQIVTEYITFEVTGWRELMKI